MAAGQPSKNPIVQQMQLLMSGRGFNFYDNKNQARADDLLVRQRASGFLGDAGQALTAVEADFRHRFIPASTRDNPYPPADAMAKLREIGQLRTRLADLETDIRGMPVPTQDRIWWRFREERALLEQLVNFDFHLVTACSDVADRALAVTADDWNAGAVPAAFAPQLKQIEDSIRQRRQFLAIQVI
jgi:hypothetical protein